MPACLACNGSGEQYVDWADDYCTCPHCDKGQVSDKVARLQERARAKSRRKLLKNSPSMARAPHKPYQGYRIQQVSLQWTDWDTIGCESWHTIRVVETLAFGVHLVNQMNEKDAPYCDYGPPYRLVSPNGRVVNCIGEEGGTAYSARHYPVPGEY